MPEQRHQLDRQASAGLMGGERKLRSSTWQPIEALEPRMLLSTMGPPDGLRPFGAMAADGSEFMLGEVYVNVVLFESTVDSGAATENWSQDRIDKVKSEIEIGVNWWKDTLENVFPDNQHYLNFNFDFTHADDPVEVAYEPITQNGFDTQQDSVVFDLIGDFLTAAGEDGSGSDNARLDALRNYNDQLRLDNNTHWAFTILVVDSLNDVDGAFADGAFAFANRGGPMFVMTYDNSTTGINSMEIIAAHETAHMFWGLDEHTQGESYTTRSGYYNTQNTNAFIGHPAPATRMPSIMAEPDPTSPAYQVDAYNADTSPASTLAMIGWQDTDGDGIFDVLDEVVVSGQTFPPLALGVQSITFDAATGMAQVNDVGGTVQALINQNPNLPQPQRHNITINAFDTIEYRIDGGAWMTLANPHLYTLTNLDLAFDASHLFAGDYTIDVRAIADQSGSVSNIVTRQLSIEAEDLASISGRVFHDFDGDRVLDGDEPALAGRRVFVDLDSSGTFTAGDLFDFTDADGGYMIDGLLTGTYDVLHELPAGWNDSGKQVVPITTPGQAAADVDFAAFMTGITVMDLGDPVVTEPGESPVAVGDLQRYQFFVGRTQQQGADFNTVEIMLTAPQPAVHQVWDFVAPSTQLPTPTGDGLFAPPYLTDPLDTHFMAADLFTVVVVAANEGDDGDLARVGMTPGSQFDTANAISGLGEMFEFTGAAVGDAVQDAYRVFQLVVPDGATLVDREAQAGDMVLTLSAFNGVGADTATRTFVFELALNTPLVAEDDQAQTAVEQPVQINVLNNDFDPDGDGLIAPGSVTITQNPEHGDLFIHPTIGFVVYTPEPGFAGQDSFKYTIMDDQGAVSNEATVTVDVAAPEPNIVLSFNGADIADGQPQAIDLGTHDVNGQPPIFTFIVTNDGLADLELGEITVPAGYTLVPGAPTTVAPQALAEIRIELDTGSLGTFAGQVAIASNDPDEDPFNFDITAMVAVPPAPEVTVLLDGVGVLDGEMTPIDFGTVLQGDPGPTRTFTVRNDGDADLHLDSLVLPAGFIPLAGLDSVIAPGESDTFIVQLNTASAGVKSGEVTFVTNDADENPFNFAITGNVLAAQEIAVARGATDITSGTGQTINFGSVLVGSARPTATFTVTNTGQAELTLGAVTLPAGFAIVQALPGSLAGGASAELIVEMDTAAAGVKAGQLSIANNDSDENPFTFNLTGAVTEFEMLQFVVGDGGDKQIDWLDADGTLASLKAKGATVTVTFIGTGLSEIAGKKGSMVEGTDLSQVTIEIAPTSDKSNLKFKAKGGTDDAVEVHSIESSGAVDIKAKQMMVTDHLSADGVIGKLDLYSAAGMIEAWAIGKLGIVMDMTADMTLNGVPVAGGDLLGKGKIGRNVADSVWRIAGGMGKTKVGDTLRNVEIRTDGDMAGINALNMDGAKLYAGVEVDVDDVPDVFTDFSGNAEIGKLNLKGVFRNSILGARTIAGAKLGMVELDNGGQPFGIGTSLLGKFQAQDAATGEKVKIKSAASEGELVGILAELGIDLEDFTLRIV